MARTIDEIKSIITEEKTLRLELNEIDSDSKVSIFNGIAYTVAVAINSFEAILDLFKVDIDNTLKQRINGTPQFYVSKAYEFQDGDSIRVSDDGTMLEYPIIDTSKRIITRANYEELELPSADTKVLIKVAKGEAGDLEPLDIEEKARFGKYLNEIKFAGMQIEPISKIGDILIPRLTVYHDGLALASTVSENVNEAILAFAKELAFDSSLYETRLIDAIQLVDNVTDVYIDPTAMPAQGIFIRSYDDGGVLQAEEKVTRKINLASGYLKESSKEGLEVDVPNFSDVIIIIAD